MTDEKTYLRFETGQNSAPIKAWVRGVPFDDNARRQLENTARLPFIYKWVAAMPDVHSGIGATVGSVVATKGAIIPAAVGVDIGCGMAAVRTTLTAAELPDTLRPMRTAIEKGVPHGFTASRGKRDVGSWHHVPGGVMETWKTLDAGYKKLIARHPKLSRNHHPT